jgi:hypothetical protein
MKYLLFTLYYVIGLFAAFNVACAIGMAFASVIALFSVLTRPKNIFLVVFYLLIGAIPAVFAWGSLFAVGEIGDRTNYVGQVGVFVGAAFPGILFLGIIPGFSKIALNHINGLHSWK